ncbi:hypothetical protein PSHT_05955 [Puccinia striiformis]|uniref:Uncharacterized protein n=1 Tax=Puccinia striiformis TaxID=27350 RepID=A0A2S4W9B5_9BASI|nr:hypothetical protein PSHT_05955 [Puccinia striiformis]
MYATFPLRQNLNCPSSAWTLIALLNKVVGFYDILAIFHGAHLTQVESFPQCSQRTYLHNILTIGLVIYGLQATGEVDKEIIFFPRNEEHENGEEYTPLLTFGLPSSSQENPKICIR